LTEIKHGFDFDKGSAAQPYTESRCNGWRVRRGGGGSWVVGWIAPFVEHSQSSGGMGYGTAVYNITNNIFTQVINAAQATFQTQNTDVFNSGANAIVDVGPNQASAISRT
jgi:hypothetical protein